MAVVVVVRMCGGGDRDSDLWHGGMTRGVLVVSATLTLSVVVQC